MPPAPSDTAAGSAREPAFFTRLSLRARWCGSWQAGVVLTIISLCVLLPGLFSIPAIDRDESRFAQASRQMLETGNFIVPMVQDRPRLNKPPLIYWLQGASTAATLAVHGAAGDISRDAIWMYRLPSMLAALCTVLLTWRLGLRMLDARAAFIGAAAMALCPLLIVDAHQARADQVLVACTLGAMLLLWRVLHEEAASRGSPRMVEAGRVAAMPAQAKQALAAGLLQAGAPRFRAAWWALWVVVGVGILAKGPITPMVVLLCVLAHCALQRSWHAWKLAKPMLGMLVALACVLPWVVLVAMQVGPSLYFKTIFDETIGRSLEPKEGHWGPPGYHLLLLTPLLFPITLVVGAAVVQACKDGLARPGPDANRDQSLLARLVRWKPWQADRARLFLLSWALPSFIVFEFVSTKLPHYPLPTYAAFALLGARAALSLTGEKPAGLLKLGYALWALVGCIGLGGACIALSSVLQLPPLASTLGYAAGGTALVLLITAGFAACLGKLLRALLLAGLATALSLSTVLGVLLPNAGGTNTPWIARDAALTLLQEERELRTMLATQREAHEAQRVAQRATEREARKQAGLPELGDVTEPIALPLPTIDLACCVFKEDSLIFLTHGRIQRVGVPERASNTDTSTDDERAGLAVARWLQAHPLGLMLTTKQAAQHATTTLQTSGTAAHTLATLRGFNHPRGKMVDLVVLSLAEPAHAHEP